MKKGKRREMKTLKSAGAVPGRSAAERRNALRSGDANLRGLTIGETAAVSGWAVVSGVIVTAPAWWDYAGADVLMAACGAFGVLCLAMRLAAALPRYMRQKRREREIGLTFVNRRRDAGRRLGYVSSEAICAAARYARGERV